MAENVYDEVPYPSYPYIQSHPDRLATVATLLGLTPTPVDRCRVLELGAASGGNIIPMGYSLPRSEFFGIDYSARQIADGQKMVQALGLTNVRLEHLDILQVNAELGQFDYIIAHGIYSWVPPDVRDRVLEICKENLRPNGIAYVSYNVYPGWGMIGLIRDMMLYRTRNVDEPGQRVAKARELLDFLSESVADDSVYGEFVKAYNLYRVREKPDPYADNESFILHDELEDVNDPVYFHQFAEHSARHGLQYVGDAVFSSMFASNYPPQVSDGLNKMSGSLTDFEQYMDFLDNRTFRQSLLCHQGLPLSRKLSPQHLINFHIASSAVPLSKEPDIGSVSVEKFVTSDEAAFSTDHPVTKAAMLYLSQRWPQAIAFGPLLTEACAFLKISPSQEDAQALATNLLIAYSYNSQLVDLHTCAPNFITQLSQQPVASPLARLQVEWNFPKVTNLRHERVTMNELTRYVLYSLDGTHSRDDLLGMLAELVSEGKLALNEDDDNPHDGETSIRDRLATVLDKRLPQIAHSALLIG